MKRLLIILALLPTLLFAQDLDNNYKVTISPIVENTMFEPIPRYDFSIDDISGEVTKSYICDTRAVNGPELIDVDPCGFEPWGFELTDDNEVSFRAKEGKNDNVQVKINWE